MSFDKERQRQMAINQQQSLMKAGIAPPQLAMPVIKPVGPKDMEGRTFAIGQKVVRPVKVGNVSALKISTVTHLSGQQVYCDDSMRGIGHPERMLIIQEPQVSVSPIRDQTHWPFPLNKFTR